MHILSIVLGLKALTLVLQHHHNTDGGRSIIRFVQPLGPPRRWEKIKQHLANPENLGNPGPLPAFELLPYENVNLDVLTEYMDKQSRIETNSRSFQQFNTVWVTA